MRSLDQLKKVAHSGQWNFDELLEWYHDKEIRIAELEAALQKIANADDIFYDPYNGKYFRELQEIARKELSDEV